MTSWPAQIPNHVFANEDRRNYFQSTERTGPNLCILAGDQAQSKRFVQDLHMIHKEEQGGLKYVFLSKYITLLLENLHPESYSATNGRKVNWATNDSILIPACLACLWMH